MPTVNQGAVTTFADQIGIVRDVSSLILMLSPDDVPLLNWLPGLSKECIGTKHEWLEDELVPVSSTLNGGIDAAVTAIVVATGSGAYFLPDDLVKVDEEVMLVTAVNHSTHTLTVATRPYGNVSSSNPAAAHLTGATISRIGVAKKEGADAGEPRFVTKTSDFNYTQIFDEIVKVTGTRQAIAQYGIEDQYARELMKVVKQKAILAEQAIIHGKPYEDVTNQRRTMGGFLHYCSVNKVDASGAAITKAVLDDMTQQIWRAGGSPRTLVMNIDQKNRLFDIYENRIRTTQSESQVGGEITTFRNDLGTFEILLDRWVPRDKILVIDKEKVGFGPLRTRGWSHELLGKRGDYAHGQMLGEFTMEVRGRSAHGLISGLAL